MKRLLISLALIPTAQLTAQGLLITPAGPTAPTEQASPQQRTKPTRNLRHGVHIVNTKIHADIVDGVATTTIDQTIHNNTRRIAEGTWFLPLPAGAVADGFTMTVGGEEISGEVLDAKSARNVYESIVRKRRDPGLLEYAGEGMLRARIFPIPAFGDVGITVRLRQVLQPTGGMFEWSFPLGVAKLGDAASGPVGLEVKIKSQTALASVVTPHADAEIRRQGDHGATISLEGKKGDLEDLRVLYGLSEQEFGLHMLPYRKKGEPGYFTLMLSPPRALAEDKLPARLVQLIIDTSGSMKGNKIVQAKASLQTFLASLRAKDRFQVITFASGVETFFDTPQLATPANIRFAADRVDTLEAMGGTNIAGALSRALEDATPTDDSAAALTQIVFITDGQPTVGVTKPNEILELTKELDLVRTRIFALGVGDRIDVRLLDDLVEQHHGARDFVSSKEKIETKVDALCQKISRPALADVVVRIDGLNVFQHHPTNTRDLFCGEMMQVVGRYRDDGKHVVKVTGSQNGKPVEYEFPVTFPKTSLKHSFVQTLWARQHIAALLGEVRRNGAKQELVTEIRQLATRYGIVTPYTSQLIVEEGMRLAGRTPRSRRQPIQYRGPGDRRVPAPGGGGSIGRTAGPSTGGPAGPSAPRPSGPATGGPAGPSTGGPSGPATGGPTGPRGGPHGPITGGRPAPRTGGARGSNLGDIGKSRTGKSAIKESKAIQSGLDDFYLGARRGQIKQQLLKRAAGRVFMTVGKDLVEQGLPKDWRKTAVIVEAYSKAYFELVKQDRELAKVFALGERIVFRDGKRIVHIQQAKTKSKSKSK